MERPKIIKVISLIQPWASLIALKEKKIETRSWKTNYRGELYIHASKKIDQEMCERSPFREALSRKYSNVVKLPTGLILCKVNLFDCLPIEGDFTEGTTSPEYFFGDYTPGRWAWILEDVEVLEVPIPAKGKLSIWEFELEGLKC